MPNSYDELPDNIKDCVSKSGQDLMLDVLRSRMSEGKSEALAFAGAWAALQKAGYRKTDEGLWAKAVKREINDDIFTLPVEAQARSLVLGLNGDIHTYDNDGQVYYMPGATHEEYQQKMADLADIPTEEEREEEESEPDRGLVGMLMDLKERLFGKRDKPEVKLEGQFTKADDEQRVVYGWASVISENGEPVVDKQGDVITSEMLVKAATEYMLKSRAGKEMHVGDQVSTTVHSFPMVKEIADAYDISLDKEGWMIAQKVHDDEVWEKVKSGELPAFSIGGRGIRRLIEDS